MKYLFSFLLLLSLSLTPHRAFASFVAGALEPTQLLNLGELIPTDLSTSATALNTQLLQYKATVLDPMGDVLIAVAQLQTSNGILNLINGGFQGSSLIIGNPRSYVDQQGLSAVKIGLGALASQNGAYSNSLLSSLTNNFKSLSFTAKVQNISQSAIPSIVQKNACDDATLSDLAKQDVAVEGQPLDQAAYTARKQYFYDKFCKGNASDPKTAAALQQLQSARPNIGGWDSWLALTGGDNAYTKGVQANEAISEEEQARRDAAQRDLANGRGVISQKKCLVRAPTDVEGQAYPNPESAPCISDVVLNPSGLLQDSLTKASNAGLDRLGNIQGWGALVGALTKITGLANGVRTSVGGELGASNTSTSASVATAPTNNLVNDPSTRATIVDPMNRLLDTTEKMLTDLKSTDQQLAADLAGYVARLNEVKACYDQVSPQDPTFLAFYQKRSNVVSDLQGKISDDATKIAQEETAIQTLRAVLATSQSSTQIQDAFFAYQDAVRNLPDYTTLAQRKTDYATNKSKATADMGTNGELTRLGNQCESMRSAPQF